MGNSKSPKSKPHFPQRKEKLEFLGAIVGVKEPSKSIRPQAMPKDGKAVRRANGLIGVDTVFCLPSICMPDLKKSKNIIFHPWGHENVQNYVAQLIRTLEHPKFLFQLKRPKCPQSTQGWLIVKQCQNPHEITPFIFFFIKPELLGDFQPL